MAKKEIIIQGMTCQSCISKVKEALENIEGVVNTEIDFGPNKSIIDSSSNITEAAIEAALKPMGYSFTKEIQDQENKNINKYLPLLLSFAFLLSHALFLTLRYDKEVVFFMHVFMGGFFLLFSFFKFLDLKAFADSFSTYDILAKKVKLYAYAYPFIELILGFAYIGFIYPKETYLVTLIIMVLGTIGVTKAVFSKQQIKCACMGAVFNVPMSTLTIIENSIMIVMSIMLLLRL